MNNDKPIKTLQDGTLKATVWRNVSNDGKVFYPVQFSRGYTDENDEWHDSGSFTNSQLLRLSRLAAQAYDAVIELKASERKEAS